MKNNTINKILNDSVDSEFSTGSETILVVDDEPLVSMIGAKLLKKAGYHTIEAENSVQAIRVIESRDDIDLLFTDIVMPGDMDGRGLAQWVFMYRPEIKVLLTSGYYEISDGHVKVNSDDIPVLKKPYKKSELLINIRTILDS